MFQRIPQRLFVRLVQGRALLDMADDIRRTTIERLAQTMPNVDNGRKRKLIQKTRLHREDKRDLVR